MHHRPAPSAAPDLLRGQLYVAQAGVAVLLAAVVLQALRE